jgi:hypothetical protein
MLDIQTIAANPGFPLNLANHRFSANEKGELTHFVEGELRATIPPEGWDDYVKYWPASIDVVRQLRAKASADAAIRAQSLSTRLDNALAAAGADPKIAAAVKAALGVMNEEAATPRAPAVPADPLADPQVQAALAVLKGKGIQISGA